MKNTDIQNQLFDPKIPLNKQSNLFQFFMLEENKQYRILLQEWATGFIDRDGKDKFVKEFQSTFNSSFWELYIYAILKKLGYNVSFNFSSPDFVCEEFILEAVITNPSDKGKVEYFTEFLNKSPNMVEIYSKKIITYASERLMQAISGKIDKYKKYYYKLKHVENKPFIICVAPFEQEFSQLQGTEAIIQCLYGVGNPLYLDENKNDLISDRTFIGTNLIKNVTKFNGSNILTGLFCKQENSCISAIIFSSTATISKVHALSTKKDGTIFKTIRYNENNKYPTTKSIIDAEYSESLIDGLNIFLNPLADRIFDLTKFLNSGAAVSLYDTKGKLEYAECPDGFLLFRSSQGFFKKNTRKSELFEEIKIKNQLKPLLKFNDSYDKIENSVLKKVDAIHGIYKEQWIAYFKNWTIFVSLCPEDNDWGWIANNKYSSTIQNFINNNSKKDIITLLCESSFFETKEEALENAIQEIKKIIK